MSKFYFDTFPWVDIPGVADGGWTALTIRPPGDTRPTVGSIATWYATEDAWLTNLGFEKGIKQDAEQLGVSKTQIFEDISKSTLKTLPGEGEQFLIPVLIRESVELTYIIRGALERLEEDNLLGELEFLGTNAGLKKLFETRIDGRRAIEVLVEEMENYSETSAGQAERDAELQAEFDASGVAGPAPPTPRSNNELLYGIDNQLPSDRKKGNGMSFSEATLRLKKNYGLCAAYDPFHYASDNANDELSQQPYGLNLMGNFVGYFDEKITVDSLLTVDEQKSLFGETVTSLPVDTRQDIFANRLNSKGIFSGDKTKFHRNRVDVSSRTITVNTLISYYPESAGDNPPAATGPALASLRLPSAFGRASDPPNQDDFANLSADNRSTIIRFSYFNTVSYNNICDFISVEHAKFVAKRLVEARQKQKAGGQELEPVRSASRVMSGARATAKTKKQGDPARDAAVRILDSQILLLRNIRNILPVAALTWYQKTGQFDNPIAKNLRFENLISYYGEPEAVIPLVNNPLKGLKPFLNASNSELSTLVPKLTFFIGDKTGKRRKIEFPDHVHDYQLKAIAKARSSSAIKDMLRNRSTHGTDAGVKSFTWNFDHQHEGDFAVKANLSLFFGSALDLMNDDYRAFLYTTGEPNMNAPIIKGNRFKSVDKAKRVEKTIDIIQKRTAKLRDTGLNPPTEGKDDAFVIDSARASKGSMTSRPSLGLYVRVGWAVPEGKMPSNVSKNFKDTIRSTQREIKLNLSGHDIEYNTNGQLTLNLKYIGSIGNALDQLSRSDVLSTTKADLDVDLMEFLIPNIVAPLPEDSINPEISRLDAVTYSAAAWPSGYIKRKSILKYQSTPEMPSPNYELKNVLPSIALAKTGVEYELRTLDVLLRTFNEKAAMISPDQQGGNEAARLQGIIKDILNWRSVAQTALNNISEQIREPKYASILNTLLKEKKIYYGRIIPRTDALPENAYGKVVSGNYSDATHGVTRNNYDIVFTKKQPKTKSESKSARRRRIQDALATAFRTGQNPALLLDPTTASISDFDLDYGSRNLYYIRLGDILDTVLQNINNQEKNNDDFYKVILGCFRPVEYGFIGFQEEDVFMLSDLPISIEYFGQFFIETVVAPQRDSISLKEFLDSLQRKLLAPMFREFAKSQGVKSSPIFVSTPIFSGVELDPGSIVDLNELRRLAFAREQSNLAKNKYLVLSPRTVTYQKRRGNESEDLKNGIYHLKIGTDRGIVKSFASSDVNLTRFHRAMQVEKSNQPDGFLVVPQNFDLTLVGNQFFPNGSTIYIDADVGFGREISTTLGIGGYYSVVRSSHRIEGGTFETVLSCKWVSSGNRDGL